jgi:hypothetical protein
MKGFTTSMPEIFVEVWELSERYETVLEPKDVAVLDAMFWNGPHTVTRFTRTATASRPFTSTE